MNFPSISFSSASRVAWLTVAMGAVLFLCACAVPVAQKQKDYTAFRENRPHSILVMPPVNQSPEIKAAATFLATSTRPLAESGYYVIPVALSEETFRQNGVIVAEEAHAIELGKLREIFGADAALYIRVTHFGTSYRLINSVVEAAASAKLVDLRTGRELWSGGAFVAEESGNAGGGLIGALVSAAVSQIVNTLSDRSHDVGRRANDQMLSAGRRNSILFGPYHPRFETD
jgi:hypothetical protein